MRAVGEENCFCGILFAAVILIASACSRIETNYFQGKVNEATHQQVANRYGVPHKIELPDENHRTWIYFERGSAVSGYAGYGRPEPCRAYHLTFDQEGILRDWSEQSCSPQPARPSPEG
ncbi:MAG TPA: hypothetical protein VLA99_01145 [Nitrospiraceae bacterium]|nr:hypothetical protein [Nitrospiraceae bacterium]